MCAVRLWSCSRSALVDNGRFGRVSPRRDGNSEDMALRQFALTLMVLLGSAAVGNGKFGAEHLSGFCLDVFSRSGHRCCRASLWRSDLANPYQASADLKWTPTCDPPSRLFVCGPRRVLTAD